MKRLVIWPGLLLTAMGGFPASGWAQAVLWSSTFTNSGWLTGWNNAGASKTGIAFGTTNITRMTDATAPGGAFLRLAYPATSYAPSGSPPAAIGGAQFYGAVLHANGNTPLDALDLQFSVRFPTNFNFVKGGKLPGLYSGTGNTGTDTPNGTDGFTTRFMWRTNGEGEAYPFLPNSPDDGTELGKGNWSFAGDNKWHTLRQECTLNDPGATNGVIRAWYDGALLLTASNLLFRTTNALHIDGVIFQTFFGGGDPTWATPVATYADFANFSVFAPPPANHPVLSARAAAGKIILSWPTNGGAGFTLESARTVGAASNVWSLLSTGTVVAGNYSVTNVVGGTNAFYRLRGE